VPFNAVRQGRLFTAFTAIPKEILRLGFPVASFGSYAQDQGSRGNVIDWRVPIELNSVAVRPRVVIYGDLDGVIVVPAEAVEQAFAGAIEKGAW